eukprot:TRINITY_DN2795_c0_g2_i1.p1 TRINITY_DN2795_c0_g2~~TRINITY_DN2795_c0_g2_i1.p1  ORF type:complete len:517 (-),score=42.97 TRINITY_DN2795_c0_g2_i1:58-1608(-)
MDHINKINYHTPIEVELFESTYENSVNLVLRYFRDHPAMANDLPLCSYARVTKTVFSFWATAYFYLTDLKPTLILYPSAPFVYAIDEVEHHLHTNNLVRGVGALSMEEEGIFILACCIAKDDKACVFHGLYDLTDYGPLALEKIAEMRHTCPIPIPDECTSGTETVCYLLIHKVLSSKAKVSDFITACIYIVYSHLHFSRGRIKDTLSYLYKADRLLDAQDIKIDPHVTRSGKTSAPPPPYPPNFLLHLRMHIRSGIFKFTHILMKDAHRKHFAERIQPLMDLGQISAQGWVVIYTVARYYDLWNTVAWAASEAYRLFPEDDEHKLEALYTYIVAYVAGANHVPLREDLYVPATTTTTTVAAGGMDAYIQTLIHPHSPTKKEMLVDTTPYSEFSIRRYNILLQRARKLEKVQKRWFGKSHCYAKMVIEQLAPVLMENSTGDKALYRKLTCTDDRDVEPKCRVLEMNLHTTPQCSHCKAIGVTMSKCGRCKKTYYCGAECQKKGWSVHKKDCVKIDT